MSRLPYEPCPTHSRTYCPHASCKQEEHEDNNAGTVSVNTDGHLAMGLGGGLAVDLTDGSIGVDVGGFTVDTGS